MRREWTSFRRHRGGFWLFLLVFSPFPPAFAGQVNSIAVDQGATGTRAEIHLQGRGEYKTLALHGPERLVVDLPASAAASKLRLPAGAGVVKSVRTGQPTPDTLRVVFDLAEPVASLKPRMEASAGGSTLVIEWPGDGPAKPTATAASAPATSTTVAASPATAPDPGPSAAQATAALASAVVEQTRQPTAAAPTSPATTPREILEGGAGTTTAQTQASAATTPATPAQTRSAIPLGDYLSASGQTASVPAATANAAPAAVESATVPAKPVVPAVSTRGTRPLVIAIDAGHGGQDPGAIGPTGKREKDATLAIARELARQVNATSGMKAYLVRDGDYFIPLPQRAQKARAAKADLFVSIHADAAENRSATGSSVYVLSLKGASSQRARWLADKENASDLVGGVRLQKVDNTLSSVLIDLAQSGHMKASEDAASHVLDGLGRVGSTHKPRIERANFAVLRTSDMPAMLVETAFISNQEEERQLQSPAFQRKLASAVLDGVRTYFTRQPPPGTWFAARAQAMESGSAAAGAGGSP